jgi:hypothetical protein
MGLCLEVVMDCNRRTVSLSHPSMSRQGDRWVGATLMWGTSQLSVRLERGGGWELRADGANGTNVLRGRLGSNEVTQSFEPKEGMALSA